MNTVVASQADDASLVLRSLGGSKEAFGRIVSRYQSLICSVAYSATGSISRSEDLAQETFLTAWKDLRGLREPASLRPWLCGITRNLVHNALRGDTREPASAAEPIESAADAPTQDPLPTEQAISREEEAILWRSIERIPENYREPMVLFYREHQSVEKVATSLGLSEDLVRQRLSRGRKLLHEQVLAFVEGALERTSPGQAFTLGVVAALPGFSASAGAAIVASTAAKGSALAKMAGTVAIVTALVGPAITFLSNYASIRATLNMLRTSRERAVFFRQLKVAGVGAVLLLGAIFGLILPRHFWFRHQVGVVVFGASASCAYALWLAVILLQFTRETRAVRAEEEKRHPELFAPGRCGTLRRTREYRSSARFLGLPLLHVRYAPPPEHSGPALGWIAVGDRAVGVVFALGAMATGGVSVGSFAVGVVAVGGVTFGLVSLGSVSFGILALGSLAVGVVALGGFALGWTGAAGAVAVAHDFAVGGLSIAEHAGDAAAIGFAEQHHLGAVFWFLLAVIFVLAVGPASLVAWRTRRLGPSPPPSG